MSDSINPFAELKFAIMVRVDGDLIVCPGRYDTRELANAARDQIEAEFDPVHEVKIVSMGV